MALELSEPDIVTLDEFMIAGLAHRGPPEDDFEAIWTDFDERFDEFPELTKTGEYYGVIYEYDQGDDEFTYVAGVPVEDESDISPELTVVEIPESTFAVFETSATEMHDLLAEVTEEWAESADHEPVDGPMFEYYGAGNEPTERTGGYEFYVPIDDDLAEDDLAEDDLNDDDLNDDEY